MDIGTEPLDGAQTSRLEEHIIINIEITDGHLGTCHIGSDERVIPMRHHQFIRHIQGHSPYLLNRITLLHKDQARGVCNHAL